MGEPSRRNPQLQRALRRRGGTHRRPRATATRARPRSATASSTSDAGSADVAVWAVSLASVGDIPAAVGWRTLVVGLVREDGEWRYRAGDRVRRPVTQLAARALPTRRPSGSGSTALFRSCAIAAVVAARHARRRPAPATAQTLIPDLGPHRRRGRQALEAARGGRLGVLRPRCPRCSARRSSLRSAAGDARERRRGRRGRRGHGRHRRLGRGRCGVARQVGGGADRPLDAAGARQRVVRPPVRAACGSSPSRCRCCSCSPRSCRRSCARTWRCCCAPASSRFRSRCCSRSPPSRSSSSDSR